MFENVFNIYYFVSGDMITVLGVSTHSVSATDEEKLEHLSKLSSVNFLEGI